MTSSPFNKIVVGTKDVVFLDRGKTLSQSLTKFVRLTSIFGSVCLRVDHPDKDEPPVRVDAFLYILSLPDPSLHQRSNSVILSLTSYLIRRCRVLHKAASTIAHGM